MGVDKRNREDTADVSCIRRKKERRTERMHRKSPRPAQPALGRSIVNIRRGDTNSTPPPLRGTSGSSSPQRWEILFNLFLDDLGGTRNGSFLNHILNRSCLGTVDSNRGRELDGGGDGCDTGVGWRRTTQDWGWIEGVTLRFCLRNGSGSVFGLNFGDNDLFLDWLCIQENLKSSACLS